MTARFELHGMTSPNVRKIVLMLEEIEASYDLRLVKVFRGEQFSDDFRALNPLSKVPVLIDREADGLTMFESGAILIYLAESFARFLPASGAARYQTLTWLFAQTSNIGPMFGQLNHFRMPSVSAPYALERYRNICERLYRILDERLAAHPYLAGADYSIADIATFHWAGYLEQHGFAWDEHPHLKRWRDAIAARPAAQREAEKMPRLIDAPENGYASASKSDMDRFFWRT